MISFNDPNKAEALFWKGIEMGFLDKLFEAAQCLKVAISLNPSLRNRFTAEMWELFRPYGIK